MKNGITLVNLTKRFDFPVRNVKAGWLENLLFPVRKQIIAVNNLSVSIAQGERVALIGPNGAGKSTTIKMLTGILHPTSGEIDVFGLNPVANRVKLARKTGVVFGQRSQLLPNLPLRDSLELFGVMYDLSPQAIRNRIAELTDLFGLEDFKTQPVRKLSLGQRMRVELAASLMHSPEIIFLDEPTIGLDLVAKKNIRDLLLKLNRENGITLFLTSHDVEDIESLCERTIIMDNGRLIFDSPTRQLVASFADEKFMDISAKTRFSVFPPLPKGLTYVAKDALKVTIALNTRLFDTRKTLVAIATHFDINDINIYNVKLETAIRRIYEKSAA
ncbi:MAG: ATP-binding cassette domain-containing protein [Opitutaceae bacterium]|jgi:ABC-2 type transport system ATP-binding protein|nr:ATP-binding cassette domain-containing protein [Opitutaceae bacterium]